MSLRLIVAFLILASSTQNEARQSPAEQFRRGPLPPGTGSISGRVVDSQSGEPLANVAIMLAALRTFNGNRQTTTDATGFYQFTNLAEHDYHIVIQDPLYLGTCYGAPETAPFPCDTVTVLRDQSRTDLDFRLTPGAVLRGRVVDAEDRPVAGATITAAPGPSVSPSIFRGSAAQTKADGTFELLRLPAGDTVLSLDMPVTADRPRPPAVFYPGVTTIDAAETIRVAGGLVTSGITFSYPRIASRSLTARISAPASGATDVKAWLYRVEPRMVRAFALDADGAGTIKGLLEGRYFVAVHAQSDREPLVAFEEATLLDDTMELGLMLQAPGRIKGRIVPDKGGLPPLSGVRVAATWIDDGEEINPLAADDVEVAPDGVFRIDGLFGVRTIRVLGLPPEWQVLSIRQGRSEISPAGLAVPSGATLDLVITVGLR